MIHNKTFYSFLYCVIHIYFIILYIYIQLINFNYSYFSDCLWANIVEPIEVIATETNPMYEDNFSEFAKKMGLMPADPDFNLIGDNNLSEGQISLAFEKLTRIPQEIADSFAVNTNILDLSHNNLTDLSFLCNFHTLHSLILDKNSNLDEDTLPKLMPSLKLLW